MNKQVLFHFMDIVVLGFAAMSAVSGNIDTAILGIVVYLTSQSITNLKGAIK